MRTALTLTPPSALRDTVAGGTGGGGGATARTPGRTVGAFADWPASNGDTHSRHTIAITRVTPACPSIRKSNYNGVVKQRIPYDTMFLSGSARHALLLSPSSRGLGRGPFK